MPRMVDVAAVFLVIGSACALYGLKHDTRRVEMRLQGRERTAEKLERDIAVLKAERAYLGRPERIEPLARMQGLEPVREHQYLRVGEAVDDGIARLLDLPLDPPEPENSER